MDADAHGEPRFGLMIAWLSAGALCLSLVRAALVGGHPLLAIALGLGSMLCGCLAMAAIADDDEGEEPRAWGEDGTRWSLSDDEFERLVREVEIRGQAPTAGEVHHDHFAAIVSEALEDLPDWAREEISRNVSVLVGEDGDRPDRYWHPEATGLYGLYHPGETGPDWRAGARITIFRDTLMRDFGHDEAELKHQITQTVRHEVAHHFGADERRVQELGL